MSKDCARTVACLQCGFCCIVGPCSFGVWDPKENRCAYLGMENHHGQRDCLKYDEITEKPGADISPAFGAGCCAPAYNQHRQVVAHNLQEGNQDVGQD